jgi:hypothetical protein
MSSKRGNFLAAGAGTALVACVALAGSAGIAHASGPSASVSLSASSVTVGTDPAVNYNVSGAPSGSVIYLEQSTNGGQNWQPVRRLPASRGSVDLRPAAAGTYNYQIIVQQGGTVVLASAPTTLTVDNSSSQSGNSWIDDIVPALAAIFTDPVKTFIGWLGF